MARKPKPKDWKSNYFGIFCHDCKRLIGWQDNDWDKAVYTCVDCWQEYEW